MKTIRPKPRSIIAGVSAWQSHSADSTLTACTWRQVARSRSSSEARSKAAAAWTRASCAPRRAATSRTAGSSPRSTANSPDRSRIATSCPASVRALTIAPPIPPAPPVTVALRCIVVSAMLTALPVIPPGCNRAWSVQCSSGGGRSSPRWWRRSSRRSPASRPSCWSAARPASARHGWSRRRRAGARAQGRGCSPAAASSLAARGCRSARWSTRCAR